MYTNSNGSNETQTKLSRAALRAVEMNLRTKISNVISRGMARRQT